MSTLDATIATTFPMVLAPREGALVPASKAGIRHVAAADGLWREITLPWVRVLHKIANSEVRLPYGIVEPVVDVKCGPVPIELRRQFVQDARDAMPNEMAAALIWVELTDQWRYEMRHSNSASREHVDFKEVALGEGEFLVVDLHSHATFDAYFSKEDDADDKGSMKFSGVVGSLSEVSITSVLRLNMIGNTWGAFFASNGKLEVVPC